MKRLVPLAFALLLLLTGCEIKEYTPELPLTFTQKARVSSGDFSFNCEICKTKERVCVTVLSTSASGMTMTYDGSVVSFSYSNYEYTVDKEGVSYDNIAITVYDVINCLFSDSNVISKKTDSGYRFEGKTASGTFKLILNDDNTLNSIVVPSREITVSFLSS